jgi:hypothetical protein
MIERLTKKRALELTILEWEELYKFPASIDKCNTEVISALAKNNEIVCNDCFCCEYVYQQNDHTISLSNYRAEDIHYLEWEKRGANIPNSYICKNCPLYNFWIDFPLIDKDNVDIHCPCEDYNTPWRIWLESVGKNSRNSLDIRRKCAKDIVDACYFELTKLRNRSV